MKSNKRQQTKSDSGFVLVWSAFIIFPLIIVGTLFVFYGQLKVNKLKAQYEAMSLVMMGGYSAEFDTNESLNAMAMLAHAIGFPDSVEPSEIGQEFAVGNLLIDHNTDTLGKHAVTAYINYNLDPISELLVAFGQSEITGLSRSLPEKVYVGLGLDYSLSLIKDHDISNLLEAFEVTGDLANGRGPNGLWNAARGAVEPRPFVQNLIPYGFNGTGRYWRPWWTLSTYFPFNPFTNTNCEPSAERPCVWSESTHRHVVWNRLTNLFRAYQLSGNIITQAVFEMTAYADVQIIATPLPAGVQGFAEFLGAGMPSSNIPAVDNDGAFQIWSWDQPKLGDLEFNASWTPGEPVLIAPLLGSRDLTNPADPFSDEILMTPNQILQGRLTLTPYRKLIRYASVLDNGGNELFEAGRYSAAVDPPLKLFANKPEWGPPTDSFTLDTGVLGADEAIQNPLQFDRRNWPRSPYPIYSQQGPGHQPGSQTLTALASPYEFTCDRGVPEQNNGPISADTGLHGYNLCRLAERCYQASFVVDCDDQSTIDATEENIFYDTSRSRSPFCPAGQVPRCMVNRSGVQLLSDVHAPWCYNGFVGCLDHEKPRPIDEAVAWAVCVNELSGVTSATAPTCVPGGTPTRAYSDSGGLVSAKQRGSIVFGENPPQDVSAWLWYFLNDLEVIAGGTWSHEAVPLARAAEFQSLTGETGNVNFVLVTDGRPLGRDQAGFEVINDTDILDEMSTNLQNFENLGGRTFTWFLGHANRYETLIDRLDAMSLDVAQQNAVDTYVRNELPIPVPSTAATAFNSISGVYGVNHYNDVVLPEHLIDAPVLSSFKSMMDQAPNLRYTETSLGSSALGPELLDEAGFLKGITYLLAWLKGRRTYDL